MSKFLSGRLRRLLVGITGYTENNTVVQTTGKVGIGTTDAQQHSLYVVGSTNITDATIVGGGFTAVGIGSFQSDVSFEDRIYVYDRAIFDSTNSIQIPSGTEAQKDAIGVAVTGQIRFNTTNQQFEGFGVGNNWGSLGGVKDVDGDTEIKAELSAGSDEDTLFFYTGGNLSGILSTTSADFNVDVNIDGNINVTGVSTFTDDISIAEKIVHTGDTNTHISFPSTDYIRLTTNGSSRLNATPTGYILLGTNNEPSGGDAHSRNARLLIQGRIGNTADSGRLNLQRGSAASNGSSIGSISFTDSSNNAYARIETIADAATGSSDYPGAIVFNTTPDGDASPTEKVRITSAGRLGVGLESPNSNLHVKGGSESTDNLLLTLQSDGVANDGSLSTGLRLINSTSDTSIHGADIRAIRTSSTTTDLAFSLYDGSTPQDERLRITSAGRVGINQSSPEYTLDLGESASTIRLVSENNGTAIRVGAGGGGNDVTLIRVDGVTLGSNFNGESDSSQYGFSLKYMGSRSQNANSLSIFSDNQSGTQVEAVTVFQDGTVGINSTSPSERLDVGGTTKTEQLNVSGIATFQDNVKLTTDNKKLIFGDNDDFEIYHDGSSNYLVGNTGSITLKSPSFGYLLGRGSDGLVRLFHGNSVKFETTGIGVSIINGTSDTATIAGPTNLVLDPAAVGDNTGIVRIKGDLYVDGTEVKVDSTTINLADLKIGIATAIGTNLLLDGGGIGIGSANIEKTILWNNSNSRMEFNADLYAPNFTTGNLDATHTDTDTLNVSGLSTFQNNVHLLDNDKLLIGGSVGTHDGLEIYHDSNHSYIDDSGTGNLYLRSGTLAIQNLAGTKTSAVFNSGAEQELRFNNSKKFETTGIGVSIYDNLNVGTAVTVYGNSGIVSATTLDTQDITISGGISTDGYDTGNQFQLMRADGNGGWEWATVPGIFSVNNILNGFNVYEEGLVVGTAGSIHTLDFRGINVTASADPQPNGIATITFSPTPTFDSVTVNDFIDLNGNLEVSGISTFAGSFVRMAPGGGNSGILKFGTGNEYQVLAGSNKLQLAVAADRFIELSHANSVFLRTSDTGIDITGGLTVSGISTFTGEIDANGRIVGAATSNVIPFLYANLTDLPSAGTYHGAFAHVHSEGAAYFAHANNWYELVNKELNGDVKIGTGITMYASTGIVSATAFYGDGSNLLNTGATLSAATGTQRIVLTSLTSGTMVDAATDADLAYNASDDRLIVNNLDISGITTLGGPVTAGSSEGVTGQYLRNVGTGVTWANFPTLRVVGVNTATAGQTAFNFVYNVDFLDVFVNGVKLSPSEYTATNGNQIVLNTPAFADEIVEFHSYNVASTYGSGSGGGGGGATLLGNLNDVNINTLVDDQVLQYNSVSGRWENIAASTIVGAASSFATKDVTRTTATANQTTFNGTYTVGFVDVYFNGAKLSEDQYTATTGTTIVLNAGAAVNDIVEVVGLTANVPGSSYTNSHVDLHLNTSTATTGQVLSWNGSDYDWVEDQIGSVGAGGTWTTDDVGINTTKSIGIGTTAKSEYKLYVQGDAKVTGIVSATSFSGSGSALTGLTGATANTYGNATSVPQIVVDANGRITGITNVLISGGGGGGTSIIVQDSQSLVGAAGTIDFGTGLSVSAVSAGIVTVTASSSGISLTDLSVTQNSAGSAALSYNDSTGVFSYTPPDLSGYLTSYTETDPIVGAVNGIVKANGSGTISAATAGTDYLAPGSEFTSQWTFSASNASNYQVTGPGFAANSTDPTIYVMRGHKYKFTNNAGSHPLQIQYEFENASATAYTDGITNSNNVITWEVRNDTPDLLHYQCTSHDAMSGRIVVLGDVVNNGSWTASAGTAQAIDTITGVSNNAIKTAEYTVHIENGSNMQSQKVLVMQNGTTAYSQEYAIMYTSTNPLVTITADINSGNLRLLATPSTGVTGDTTYTLTRQTIR